MTDLLRIEINRDNIVIEKAIVLRPVHIGVKEWTDFWESVQKGGYEEGWEDGYQACTINNDERSSFT